MSTQVQYRRGTGAQNDAFTGALAEITVDTTNGTLRVHDGIVAGGSNIATVAFVDNAINSLSANSITDGTSSVTIIATNGNIRANVGGSTIQLLSSAGADVTGYVSATGNVLGSNLTTAGVIVATGNITGGNLSGTSIVGTLTTAAQTNITSVGTLTALAVTGNIAGGNVSGTTGAFTNVSGNGSALTALNATNISSGTLAVARGGTGVTTSTGSGAVVLDTSPTFTTQITVPAIAKSGSNGVGNIGQSDNSFNTIFAKATSAQYADVAERYRADQLYEPGTVLRIGGAAEVTATVTYADPAVVGVVSTKPALIMNADEQHEYAVDVALLGRVPCRVVGEIRRGDLMITSELPGVATALRQEYYVPGCVIGKALQDYTNHTQEGCIEVLIGRL